MATISPCSSLLLSSSTHFHGFPKMYLKSHFPFLHKLKHSTHYLDTLGCGLTMKQNQIIQSTKPNICSAINMATGQSGDPEKINFEYIIEKARRLWQNSPQPVKRFPWNRAFENFVQLILDLVLAVVKYLSAPVLAVSSLSEMSYCAHQRKLTIIPVPLLVGFVLAGVLKETALELSPLLKDAEVPWHLIAIAIFFTLLKLPGPYYPYWGRIFIPHIANGALLRILWLMFMWYRRPKISGAELPNSLVDGRDSEIE
ncbi:DELAYED PALE-GREENING1, embryo defective 1273 [Hibiscus trionum]|uniref:DELAYED PALE-GREENING1, embryo defective 1273 n=1 Tax=Hibiscus trionum TaxID=183268 RepID=A0A9W7IS80_HIBTR|nr:DELAYED PALE-GREENING1, embryo defective 1273 [Hibiscus trionum]